VGGGVWTLKMNGMGVSTTLLSGFFVLMTAKPFLNYRHSWHAAKP